MTTATRLTILPVLITLISHATQAQSYRPSRGGPGRTSTQLSPTVPKTETEKRILATLQSAVQAGELYANVPDSDGRMLRLITEALNAKTVVEIGTSTGLSGLWLAMALDRTAGHLTTFEIDPARAATARNHFRQAGVDQLITIVEGDAHQTLTRLKDPIDLVFIDADKEGYLDYLNKLLPLVRPGGIIAAHNVDMIPEYLAALSKDPSLETVGVPGSSGLALTLKKR
jgi:predicted O-methyltransferase YrrM